MNRDVCPIRPTQRGIIKKLEPLCASIDFNSIPRAFHLLLLSRERGEGVAEYLHSVHTRTYTGHSGDSSIGERSQYARIVCVCIVTRLCTLCATCILSIAYVIAVHDIRWQNRHAARPPFIFLPFVSPNRILIFLLFKEKKKKKKSDSLFRRGEKRKTWSSIERSGALPPFSPQGLALEEEGKNGEPRGANCYS